VLKEMADKRINMDLPEELWKQVNMQAAKETIEIGEKVYLKDIVIKALERYLVEAKEEGK
jgi:chorismate-pyruvate lyase